MPRIELRIPGNDPEGLSLMGVCIKRLTQLVLDDEHAAEVELAMVEAITNSMRHADIGDSDILIQFTLLDNEVAIDLIDEGRPVPPSLLEFSGWSLDFDPADIQNLPTGGMGLMIIRSLMNDVSYRFEDGRNHWNFRIFPRRNTGGSADPVGRDP